MRRLSAMDVDTALNDNIPIDDEGRLSELHPRNLNSLFSTTPEQLKAKIAGKAIVKKGLKIAGAQPAHDLDLDRMQVVVRIRPSSQNLPTWAKENCIHALSACSLAIAPPEDSQGYKNGDRGQTYTFSRVFSGDTMQEQFFQTTAGPMVKQMLRTKQHSGVIMAYGISAAGKTYTIEGSKQQPGILPQSLEALFKGLEHSKDVLSVRISHCELYNEVFFDLLAPENPVGGRPALRLKEDCQGRVFVDGLSQVEVTGPEHALEFLRRSSKQRQKAATALNFTSSRSHSIFTIAICKTNSGQGPDAFQQLSRLSFVDLAGSERAGRTGNMGKRLKESVAINSSLMTLGRCLEALRFNQQYRPAEPRLVPYRESKVTHLFRDVLHGWGQILLCVNVSPTSRDYDETARVLRYAAMAAQIGVAARAEAPLRALKAITPNITKKRALRAAAAAQSRLGRNEDPEVGPSTACVEGDGAIDDKSEREELEEAVLELQAEVAHLTQQVLAAEERAALMEAEVREEVSNEMADLLREMEANYRERLAAELGHLRITGGEQPTNGKDRSDYHHKGPSIPSATKLAQLQLKVKELEEQLEEALSTCSHMELAVSSANAELKNCQSSLAALQQQVLGQTERTANAEAVVDAFVSISDVSPGKICVKLGSQGLDARNTICIEPADSLETMDHQLARDLKTSRYEDQPVIFPATKDGSHHEDLEAATLHRLVSQAPSDAVQKDVAPVWHGCGAIAEAARVQNLSEHGRSAPSEGAPHGLNSEPAAVHREAHLAATAGPNGAFTAAASGPPALQGGLESEAAAEAACLEARKRQNMQQEEAQVAANVAAAHEIAARLLQAERTQLQANTAMQLELLTGQLDRARQENLQLQMRLAAALSGFAAPEASTDRKAHSWAPGETPHNIALAWARRAVAEGTPPVTQANVEGSDPFSSVNLQNAPPATILGGTDPRRGCAFEGARADMNEQQVVQLEPNNTPALSHVFSPQTEGRQCNKGPDGTKGRQPRPAEPSRFARLTDSTSRGHPGLGLEEEAQDCAAPARHESVDLGTSYDAVEALPALEPSARRPLTASQERNPTGNAPGMGDNIEAIAGSKENWEATVSCLMCVEVPAPVDGEPLEEVSLSKGKQGLGKPFETNRVPDPDGEPVAHGPLRNRLGERVADGSGEEHVAVDPLPQRNRRITRAWMRTRLTSDSELQSRKSQECSENVRAPCCSQADEVIEKPRKRGKGRKRCKVSNAAPVPKQASPAQANSTLPAIDHTVRERRGKRRLLAPTPMTSALRQALGGGGLEADESPVQFFATSRRVTRACAQPHKKQRHL
eukprot:jgi/Botrbrau1/12764/Bobra.0238s0003.1